MILFVIASLCFNIVNWFSRLLKPNHFKMYFRSDPNVTMKLKKYTNEDVVLMLPPDKPTLDALGHFQVWCAMFNVVFGEFDMKDAHKP